MKRLVCIFLCAVITGSILCGCRKTQEITLTEETTVQETTAAPLKEREVTLGYFPGKGFNPYKTSSSLNRNLLTLVYDTLYLSGDAYSVSPLIAASSVPDEKSLTVDLKLGLTFSDGSEITASDVVYSFNLAKKSSFYSKRLSNFSSASASMNAVTFTLKTADIFAESCLTFPIVKTGTGGKSIPTGSGRYILEKKDGVYTLIRNETTSRPEEIITQKINLTPVSSDKSELYLLQSGDLSYFFDDLSDGDYTKIGANMVKIPMNNLVYVGLNRKKGVLKNKNIAKAVNLAINRTTLCNSAYEGMHRNPKSVFNPDWYAAQELTANSNPYDLQQSEALLEKQGYKYRTSKSAYRSKNGNALEMTLLVCKDTKAKTGIAKSIASSLRSTGIKVRVREEIYDDYLKALKGNGYDLYIGEIKLSANMDLSCFFSSSGSARYGIDSQGVAATAYNDFRKGAIDINTFARVFDSEIPFIPLCYRDGMAYYSREISYEGSANEYEPFKNIYSWEV